MSTPIIRAKKRNLVKYNASNGNWYTADFDDPLETGATQGQFKTSGDRISEDEARALVGDSRLDQLRKAAVLPENKDKTVVTDTRSATNTPEEDRIYEAQKLYPGRMKMQADTDELIRQIKAAMSAPGGALMRGSYE